MDCRLESIERASERRVIHFHYNVRLGREICCLYSRHCWMIMASLFDLGPNKLDGMTVLHLTSDTIRHISRYKWFVQGLYLVESVCVIRHGIVPRKCFVILHGSIPHIPATLHRSVSLWHTPAIIFASSYSQCTHGHLVIPLASVQKCRRG